MTDIRVAAAVDFGTHGTGFAWAFQSEANRAVASRDITFHDEWQGQPVSYIKNLTALLLEGDQVVEWGYEAFRRYSVEHRGNPDLKYVSKFKMWLWGSGLGDAVMAEQYIEAYLRVFYRFALERITTASQVVEDEIRWCVTVPAIWRDRERSIMRKAAVAAGFPSDEDRLLIAVEPEVAALYCQAYHDSADIVTSGKRFMVIDAGGGTVDITTYEVGGDGTLTQLGFSPGDALGSSFVDERFVTSLLPDRLPMSVVQLVREEDAHAALELRDSWERAKRGWDPERDSPMNIPLPTRLFRRLSDDELARLADKQGGVDDALVMAPNEVRRLFDDIIGRILKLVDRQLDDTPGVDSVLLVGGFAQSKHLKQRLGHHLRHHLVVPPHPASAVLLGAVHYALNPELIAARCSTYTYGVGADAHFDANFPGDLERKYVDGWGKEQCQRRFYTYVRRGDVVPVGTRVRLSFYPSQPNQNSVQFELFTTTKRYPRYTDEPGVTRIGEITIEMKEVAKLPEMEQQEIEVSIEFGGTELVLGARVVASGEHLNASFNFDRIRD